jgi:hypothetical protein
MLMEKGYATFKVKDALTEERNHHQQSLFLTTFQEKQWLSSLISFKYYLHEYYKQQGFNNQKFTRVPLTERLSQKIYRPKTNLINENENFKHKTWIPFKRHN